MNNNTTEDYCLFEVSKLLKEKRFEVYCTSLYTEDGKINDVGNYNNVDDDKYISYSRPTHSLAIKWIRENFNWNIESGYRNSHKDFSATIYPMFPNTQVHRTERFNNSEECVEAALLYTLKNLIP
jgi:hypothetical protein